MNYLALAGILNKFRRVGKQNAPSPPANFLADFASGSLHLFNQLLQALYLKKDMTMIDCSLTHSTLYLSQLELLKEVQFGSINRNRSKKDVAITPFTRPHDLVFQDSTQTQFVLTPDTKIHSEIQLQHYNDEEAEDAQILGEIMQLAFNGMTIAQIEQEYASKLEIIQPYNGSAAVSNVFAVSNTSPVVLHIRDAFEMMRGFGVDEKVIREFMKEPLKGKL